MAKQFIVEFDGEDIPFNLEKVDRTKLYGYVEHEVLDDQGKKCELVTLCGDGHTLAGKGGTALAYLSPQGKWCNKADLKPIGSSGQPIVPAKSSFDAPVPLSKKATPEDLLSYNVHLVYQLTFEEEPTKLLNELRKGTIYTYPFSYRGGLEADIAFMLIGSDGNLFMLVGKPTVLEYVGLQQTAATVPDEATVTDEPEDLLDFSMV